MRFLLANTNGFDPANNLVAVEDMLALDQWAVDRTLALQNDIREAFEDYQFHTVYQRLHNFCTTELGGFYLDIVKDRQYTTKPDSHARRSAQSAMYHIAEAMTRWIAPVLSFTAEEIWQHLPGAHSETIFTETYYEHLKPLPEASLYSSAEWDQIVMVRMAVSRALEKLRVDGLIGGSLDAEVTLFCDTDTASLLHRLGDELRFILITSGASVSTLSDKPANAEKSEYESGELWISAQASTQTKCERCWHYRHDVGVDPAHETLCSRCVQNVDGDGEPRQFT